MEENTISTTAARLLGCVYVCVCVLIATPKSTQGWLGPINHRLNEHLMKTTLSLATLTKVNNASKLPPMVMMMVWRCEGDHQAATSNIYQEDAPVLFSSAENCEVDRKTCEYEVEGAWSIY